MPVGLGSCSFLVTLPVSVLIHYMFCNVTLREQPYFSVFLSSLFKKIFIFGYAQSSLLLGLFITCSEQGPLSGFIVQASHCGGFSCGAQGL